MLLSPVFKSLIYSALKTPQRRARAAAVKWTNCYAVTHKKGKMPWRIKKTTKTNPHHLWKARFSQWSHLTIKGVPWLFSQLQWKLPHFMKSCPVPTSLTASCSLRVFFRESASWDLEIFKELPKTQPRTLFLFLWVLRAVSKTQMISFHGLPSMQHRYPPLQLVPVSNHPKQHLGLFPWHLLANI